MALFFLIFIIVLLCCLVQASAARGRMIPDERLLKEAHKEFLDGQLMFHVKVCACTVHVSSQVCAYNK